MHRWRYVAGALLLPILLAAVLLLVGEQHTTAQSGVSNFTTVVAQRDIYAGRDVLLDGFLAVTPGATAVITNGGFLTPTTTFVPLTAVAAVGMSGANIAVQPAGTLLVLVNVGDNTITFTETGTLISAGNIALGAGDSAQLISDGTNWYQISGSDN